MHQSAERSTERRRDAGSLAARQRSCRDVKDSRARDGGDDKGGQEKQCEIGAAQCDLSL
jgi:hypothetical protein